MISNKTYYIYRHIRPDIEKPFYIGRGTKLNNVTSFRKEYARAFQANRRSDFWKRVVALNEGQFKVDIVFETEALDEINLKEIEFIKLYGRTNLGHGTLVNLTDGGDGARGTKHSEETKQKIAISHLGIRPNEETRKRLSLSKKGLQTRLGAKLSQETKDKIGQANKNNTYWLGRKHNKKSIEKMRLAKLGKKHPPEFGRKISLILTGRKMPQSAIDKLISRNMGNQYAKGRKQSPEHVAMRTAKIRGKKRTPEQRKRISEAKKKAYREKMLLQNG